MLVKRKLIIKGVGYTGADALYNMLSDTYVIPLRGVQGARKLMNVAKLLKQKKVNFFEAVYLLQPEKSRSRAQDHEAGASDPAERTGAGSLL